jgi:uncharacterized cupredoxin-like copper-binding protein
MRLTSVFVVGAALVFGVATAYGHGADVKFGSPGKANAKNARVVNISMDEAADGKLSYTPGTVDVKRGETIHFVVVNHGKDTHDFFVGPEQLIDEHVDELKKNANTEMDDPSWIRVKAGETGNLVWHFTVKGDFDYASVLPGQIEAGMHGAISVK